MTEADGVRQEVNIAIGKQEAASGLLRMAKLAVEDMSGTVMALGLTYKENKARSILQLVQQVQSDMDMTDNDLTQIRAILNDWRDSL